MNKYLIRFLATCAVASMMVPVAANAAYVIVDDSDINNITITAGDFERGFSVNGNLITTGLGNSGSVTLLDGSVYSFFGNWLDLGQATGSSNVYGRLGGGAGNIQSGVESFASTDGNLGTISGNFAGYVPGVEYGPFPTTVDQDGNTHAAPGFAFLSMSFTTEAANAVPVPSTLVLFGTLLPLLGMFRRRRA